MSAPALLPNVVCDLLVEIDFSASGLDTPLLCLCHFGNMAVHGVVDDCDFDHLAGCYCECFDMLMLVCDSEERRLRQRALDMQALYQRDASGAFVQIVASIT